MRRVERAGQVAPGAFRRQVEAAGAAGLPTGQDNRVESISLAVAPLGTVNDFASEISRLWTEAQERFLAIGRYLVQARQKLGRGDYAALTARLPFSESVASKLRCVAEAVDGGKLAPADLPRDYSVAYLLASMPENDLNRARAQGLVRTDVRRRDLEDFRKLLREGRGPGGADAAKEGDLPRLRSAAEAEALRRRRKELLENIRRMEEEVRKIDAEIGGAVIEGEATEVA